MNTPAKHLTHAVMIAAALAALVMIQPAKAAPASSATAVSGKAAAVVMLPRVTVTGKRAGSRDIKQARKDISKPAAALVALR